MSLPTKCKTCGGELSAGALEGLCVECLRKLVMANPSGNPAPPAPTELGITDILLQSGGEQPGDRIGNYRLQQKIGEGGFGVVYMAEQEQPVRRRVALKVIKLGMDTRQVVARFEAERQALALMDHPNIARVLDAGATESGRPYFVMELVKGIAITKYCNQNQLPLNARLDLFIQICHAIQHAHQKGIIHRDIKPSNVMVTMHDGVPVPKVIDFGIAKATEVRLTDKTLFTQYEQFMGTPAYMSPEQAEVTGLDIDTRSDIYSLGVLLYELLTGRPPFSNKELVEKGIEEARRTIRESEPPRPSTRLSTLTHADLTQVARERSSDGSKLRSLVRGDIEWIVMKCLEKDRTRRYETANGLGLDIKRFLNQEPIVARPPSQVYLLQKLVRRHKAAFAVTTAVVTALLLGLGFSTWSFLRERAARTQLEKARAGEMAALGLARQNAAAEALQRARAQATVTRLELDQAEMLLTSGQPSEALAYLARVLRREPTNRAVGERIISALAHRNFCVPLFRLELPDDAVSAEFSPDGQRVLTACKNGTARLWDGRTGQPLLRPLQHAGEITAAHFSPDGTRIVTASLDKTARIWDAQTGQPVTAPLRHASAALCADFSPDGRRVATGSADGLMQQWNAVTGALLGPTGRLENPVHFVKFSPEGRWIAISPNGDTGGTGRVLNAVDGTEVAVFEHRLYHPAGSLVRPVFNSDGSRLITMPNALDILALGTASTNRVTKLVHNGSITAASFSPDGQTLVTCSADSTGMIWDAGTIQPIGEKMSHENFLGSVDFRVDGQQVVTGAKDGTARVWDARTGRPLTEPLRHDTSVQSVQFSSDGQRILTRCSGPGVWVWEVRSAQPLTASLQHPAGVRRAVFSPDGGRVATTTRRSTSSDDDRVRIWDTRRSVPLLPPLGQGRDDVQFSSDGRLVVATGIKLSTVWNSTTGQIVGGPFFETNNVECTRFSPDGQFLVTAGPQRTPVKVWRIATGEVVSELFHPKPISFARFSPDGQWVVTASADKTARLWDWRTGKPLTEPLAHDGEVIGADVSADSQRLVTISRDKTARIWEARTGKLLHTLRHAEEPYSTKSVQFSSDGRLVAFASGNAAHLWDSHTGQPVTAPLKHNERVNSVRFSPDGKRLVTSCFDKAARIWDVASGQLLSEPMGHLARVHTAEFSPDGRWVLTASDDSTAKIWEVPMLSHSVPPRLGLWAEAVGGQRIDERNANQSVPFEELRRLRQSLAQVSDEEEAGRWARWFFAENNSRKISPGSLFTVPQLVEQRIEQSTLDSLQQAVWLSPTNGLAQARLAYITLTNDASQSPRLLASADWQSRRGVGLSPKEPDAWWHRAQFCNHLGRLPEALDAMDRAISMNSTKAGFWNDKGLLLEKTNRLEEALQSYTKAIELSGPWKDQQTLPALAYRNRSKLNQRLNRLAEAAVDNLKARNLSQRGPRTPATHLDLSLFYTDETDEVPGWEALAAEFDLRGSLDLANDQADASHPGEILGIPIAQKCRRLHFLHAASGPKNQEGTQVALYRLHYADGQQTEIPILYGVHVRDFVLARDSKEALARNTKVAWVGDMRDKTRMRYFAMTWENERPDVAIESLDFISRRTGTGPTLNAITAEP